MCTLLCRLGFIMNGGHDPSDHYYASAATVQVIDTKLRALSFIVAPVKFFTAPESTIFASALVASLMSEVGALGVSKSATSRSTLPTFAFNFATLAVEFPSASKAVASCKVIELPAVLATETLDTCTPHTELFTIFPPDTFENAPLASTAANTGVVGMVTLILIAPVSSVTGVSSL